MDKQLLNEDIEKYLENHECAEATLLGICNNTDCDMDKDRLAILASGFDFGIGGTHADGTCGAITATVLAFGLTNDDAGKVQEMSRILFESFKEKFSSIQCGALSDSGENKTHCGEYCKFAAGIYADLNE